MNNDDANVVAKELLASLENIKAKLAKLESNVKDDDNNRAEDNRVKQVRRLAKTGDADCAFYMGYMYLHGIQVDKCNDQALEWFAKASSLGHVEASWYVAVCTVFGQLGCPVDVETGMSMLTQLATVHTCELAMQSLASCYRNGIDGVDVDLEKSFLWYGRAAMRGHAPALYQVGRCYEHGWGVENDMELASHWYVKAAQAHYGGIAEYDAGRSLLSQVDVTDTNSEVWMQGVQWLHKAACSMNNTGTTYYSMALRQLVHTLSLVPLSVWPSEIDTRLVKEGMKIQCNLEKTKAVKRVAEVVLLTCIVCAFVLFVLPLAVTVVVPTWSVMKVATSFTCLASTTVWWHKSQHWKRFQIQ